MTIPKCRSEADDDGDSPGEEASVPAIGFFDTLRAWLNGRQGKASVALVAVTLFGWLGYEVFLTRQQMRTVAAIKELGGRVKYADELPFQSLAWPFTWIKGRLGHDYATGVATVELTGDGVSDDNVAFLESLPSLHGLWLARTAITNEGLRHLRSNTSLAELSLVGTNVGDEGLANLSHLTSLQFLYLDDTDVTDAGLVSLEPLVHLKKIHLSGTKVTDRGLDRLQEALPGAVIIHRW
jgi:hypothetical protein